MKNILGSNGLTSSEANHITNVTKELVKDLSVNHITLATSVVVLPNGKELPLDENEKNEKWIENIKQTGELYSLSAWLKTAIKYKEGLLYKLDRMEFIPTTVNTDHLEPLVPMPNTEFEDYLNQLNTKDRCDYLTAEAKAAHIGLFIHNFDEVRSASDSFTPTSFRRIGASGEQQTILSERLYTKQELLDGFFDLQKEHRAVEQTVNLYKARHKEWQKQLLDERNSKNKAIQSSNIDKQLNYNRLVEAERIEWENGIREDKKSISALKILIPNDLQDTLDYVNQYAKK